MLMSFIGSIGKMIRGSGIEDLFEEVYAPNSVEDMMLGKSINRAVRAHLMAESALTIHLLEILKENDSFDFSPL